MSYTLEDYRRNLKDRALKMMTPEERLNGMEKSVMIDIIIKNI